MALYSVVFLGSTPIGAPLVGWLAQAAGPRAGLCSARSRRSPPAPRPHGGCAAVCDPVQSNVMTDKTTSAIFHAYASDYDAARRRLVPMFDTFYDTAVSALELAPGAGHPSARSRSGHGPAERARAGRAPGR